MNCFETGYKSLQLFKEKPTDGLYKNQVGAISSAIAHFSIRSEPALITMPTGTGKTAVMIILSYALRATKVLVITPSQLVREQIAESFRNPKVLLEKEIIKGKGILPNVYELTSVITQASEWKKIIKEYDVVVGIPGTINQIPNLKETVGEKSFDFIFVDEAHHSRATSWANILLTFSNTKQILLTATPFRRDKKDIRARLIYHYSLKQAFEDKLFSKINFIPVDTSGHLSEEEKNIEIAKAAEVTYKSRKDQTHKIIIRTDSKAGAERLAGIYKANTSLNLQMIHSKLTDKTVKDRIKELKEGKIDGIICVDMMGEGYDFPALKIAAVHIPHRSLAITLQFIGRISRTNINAGSEAYVVGGEHEFRIESYQLYKRDTKDWFIVLPDLHKAKIQKTEDEQDFFDSFEDQSDSNPDDDLNIEPSGSVIEDDDLKPFFHAKVYHVIPTTKKTMTADDMVPIEKPISFSGTSVLSNPIVKHHHVSTAHDIAVYIVSDLKRPSWYHGRDNLNNVKNELVIVYYDKDNSLLFICSTVRETELYEHIADEYLDSEMLHEMVPLPILKRVMAGWVDPKIYNVGMKSRKTKGNSESYRNILGSQAQKSILATDKYSYTRGHSFGGGFDSVLGKEVLLGISTSSKVWALEEKKLKYLVEWFKGIARKIGDSEMDKLPSPLSELDCGKVIAEFPMEAIFFADWDSSQYYRLTTIVFIDLDDVVVESALMCACSINLIKQDSNLIKFEIRKGSIKSFIDFKIDPVINFSYSQDTPHKIGIRRGEDSASSEDVFLSILNEHPLNVHYENMNKLVGKVLFETQSSFSTISDQQISAHTWPINVNVNKEFHTIDDLKKNPLKKSIHDYIIELACAEFDVVFYDHSSLEIADVIGLKNGTIKFFHCKKQGGSRPRCDLNDIYEVCGQAVKSVNWAHRKLLNEQMLNRSEKNKIDQKLKKGSLATIKTILASFDNPILPVEIVIVQPGLKTTGLTVNQKEAFNRIKLLLSAADGYLKDVSQCKISVLCS